MVRYANIKIWNELVGVAYWDNERQAANFEYDAKFVSKGIELSPLKMPLAARRVYSFPELNIKTFKGLPGLLADSLPDKFGNDLINKWLAEQGRDPDTYNPIERLLYQGKRGMGALEFEPPEKIETSADDRIELENLIRVARNAMLEKAKLNAGLLNEKSLNQIIQISSSAGGARAKAVIAYNEQTGEIRSGQISAPDGFSHWLLKMDGVTNKRLGDPQHYGQIEYAYYRMALACGIEMTFSMLLHENRRRHFMTRRFDRPSNLEKIHTQTLCGLAHYDFNSPGAYSYEQVFQTMRTLNLPYIDAEQMFRRMVFNVIARNQDDHCKNISFLMNRDGVWRLSPAYDMTYSYNPEGGYTAFHQLTINGKRDEITKQDIKQVAALANIRKPDEVIAKVADAVSQWQQIARELEIPAAIIKKIGGNLRTL